MTRIFVPQPIPPGAHARLAQLGDVDVFDRVDRRISREQLRSSLAGAEVLFVVGGDRFDRELLRAAPALRMIGAMQSSPRLVDTAYAAERGIAVSVIPNMAAETTAEFTFALLLATARRIPEGERMLRDGRWRQRQSMALMGTRLMGKTLGIVGAGTIGQGVARRAAGFGMQIIYTKRSRLAADVEAELGMHYRSIDEVFREADVVVLTLPLTDETRGLVGRGLLESMRAEAILVNTSRGAVLDEEALEDCLRRGVLRGAGLDVYQHEVESPERIGPRESLLALPNVVTTPHLGSAAIETRQEMAMRVVDNIEAWLRGDPPPDLVQM